MTRVIAEPCIDKDTARIEETPIDCIFEGARMFNIRPADASTAAPHRKFFDERLN